MRNWNEYIGELIGTFIIVFFGCGAVAGAVLLDLFSSLFEIAIIWGLAVALAIYTTRNLGPSHLNPAVSLAMVFAKKLELKKLPLFFLFQFIGAVLAATLLFCLFDKVIVKYELDHGFLRGSEESIKTAMIFGEFYPNPGLEKAFPIHWFTAMLAEALGTAILVFAIFKLTEKEDQISNLTILMIGFTVSIIICIIAPFTQAGLNPARDLGPRIVAFMGGWGDAAFPKDNFGFLTVYVLGPFIGASVATGLHTLITKKA
jgi:glycerol uptake facilitator protein